MAQLTEVDELAVTTYPPPVEKKFAKLCGQGNALVQGIVNSQQPRVFIISGPSGVGKDAVLVELQEKYPDARYVVTATSRPMRDYEHDGVHYLFLDRETFEQRIAEDYFIEHDLVYGKHYGVPKRPIQEGLAARQHVIVKVDVKGAESLRKAIPEAVSMFLLPETMEALWKRLNDRKTEPPDVIWRRFCTACKELERANEFNYIVFNEAGKLTAAVDKIVAIVEAEQRRVGQRPIAIP